MKMSSASEMTRSTLTSVVVTPLPGRVRAASVSVPVPPSRRMLVRPVAGVVTFRANRSLPPWPLIVSARLVGEGQRHEADGVVRAQVLVGGDLVPLFQVGVHRVLVHDDGHRRVARRAGVVQQRHLAVAVHAAQHVGRHAVRRRAVGQLEQVAAGGAVDRQAGRGRGVGEVADLAEGNGRGRWLESVGQGQGAEKRSEPRV